MLDALKKQVYEANRKLMESGLVIETFGNVSGVDRRSGNLVIKPSGVSYDDLKPQNMVVVSLVTGEVVKSALKPSSDTATHRELYRAFPDIGGVVHTHSLYATAWAQAAREIPALGTTHADYFHGPVPCTRKMTAKEIRGQYELNTGKVIVERFAKLAPAHFPGVLVHSHGPFAWGTSPDDAVHHAVVLEYLARLASATAGLVTDIRPMAKELLDKHFFRKHGPGAYYGQKK